MGAFILPHTARPTAAPAILPTTPQSEGEADRRGWQAQGPSTLSCQTVRAQQRREPVRAVGQSSECPEGKGHCHLSDPSVKATPPPMSAGRPPQAPHIAPAQPQLRPLRPHSMAPAPPTRHSGPSPTPAAAGSSETLPSAGTRVHQLRPQAASRGQHKRGHDGRIKKNRGLLAAAASSSPSGGQKTAPTAKEPGTFTEDTGTGPGENHTLVGVTCGVAYMLWVPGVPKNPPLPTASSWRTLAIH